jgi:acetate kinase
MSLVAPAHNPPYIAAMRLLAEKLPRSRWWRRSRPAFTPRSTIGCGTTRAVRMGREAAHQALGLSRRQPPLHRPADEPTAGRYDLRIISCHLGRHQQPVRDPRPAERGHDDGHEPADGAAAQQPRRRLRPVRDSARDAGRGTLSLHEVLDTLAEKSGLLGCRASAATSATWKKPPRKARAARSWPSTCSSPKSAGIWAGCWSNSAARTRSSSPAGSARTARTYPQRRVRQPAGTGHRTRPKALNAAAKGECRISSDHSRVQIWTMPTNEELIVARQTKHVLETA